MMPGCATHHLHARHVRAHTTHTCHTAGLLFSGLPSTSKALSAARLLLLILLTACVISAAVVVFSVVLIFNHSNDAVVNHLVRNQGVASLPWYPPPPPAPAKRLGNMN